MSKYEPPITDVIPTSTGQRLFVAEWPGKHPAFVFAPGLTSTHRYVAGVAAALNGDLRVHRDRSSWTGLLDQTACRPVWDGAPCRRRLVGDG